MNHVSLSTSRSASRRIRVRSISIALPLILSLVASSASVLPAQASVSPAGDRAQHSTKQATQSPDLSPGTRIRLTFSDPTLSLGSLGIPIGNRALEGVIVRNDTTSLDVRFGVETYTVPSSSISTMELRVGDGRCQLGRGARLVCVMTGVLSAAALGAWAGDKVARQLSGTEAERRTWRWRGGISAGLLMSLVAPSIGRDRWIRVRGWPVQ